MQLIHGQQSPNFLPQLLCGAALFVALLAAQVLSAQDARRETVDLPVRAAVSPDSAQKLWSVSDSWLEQDFQMTWAYVRVRNISDVAFNTARFYGEYFDDMGRLCFTAVFSADSNTDGATGPFGPGEMRTLKMGAYLSPTVRPEELRLRFLGQAGESSLSQTEVVAPCTILASTYGTGGDFRPSKPSGQILVPIALVEAATDSLGAVVSIIVIAAADDQASQWVRNLISKVRFAPAVRSGQPLGATTLILIRLVQLDPGRNIPPAPAFEDPWVRSYAKSISGKPDLPLVNLIRLQKDEATGALRYFSTGTDWGISVLDWVPNANRHGTHREWIAPDGSRSR